MSRRELAQDSSFEQISPEVGELDEDAFDDYLELDPDAAMALLAQMSSATDVGLRALARRLAGRLMLDVNRHGRAPKRGIGRITRQRYEPDRGDLDLDASVEAIAEARGLRAAVDVERLWVRGWARPSTALCLMVDRSGSMGGRPLATSAMAAAAVASRGPEDYSVVAFAKDVVVVKAQDGRKAADHVVTDVLALRGFGVTDVSGALRVGAAQLARSGAGRRIAILLSDCRSTVEGDVVGAARSLDELCIIAPEGDDAEAQMLAADVGARCVTVRGPSQIPAAFAAILE